MYDIKSTAAMTVREARAHACVTQADLAERVGTSQSAIAKLEQGDGNPTIETIERCAKALGYSVRLEFIPLSPPDPVIERYKQDVDRTLLRENLRKSVTERIRTLGEWQENGLALEGATRAARRRK